MEIRKDGKDKKDKAVVELEDKGASSKKKKRSIPKLPIYIAGALAVFGILLLMRSRSPQTASNVDTVAVVKNIEKRNQAETKQMLSQIYERIGKTGKTGKTSKAKQLSPKEQKQIATLQQKLAELQQKEKAKRDLELQKALLKQYISQERKQESSPITLAVNFEKPKVRAVKKNTFLHQVYIPIGSVVQGITMHTIPAPVERGALPLPPVLIKLTGNAYTANGFSVPLDECIAVGKAQGDWNFIGGKDTARAEVQLRKLVCVLGNGKVLEKDINAYVVDSSNGMNGLTGRKMDISGKQIAKFTGINTASAFFSSLAQSYTETYTNDEGYSHTTITKPAKYSLFSGLSKSWDKVANFYQQRLSKIYPVVIVPAHKKLQVIFLSGVKLGVSDKELERWGI